MSEGNARIKCITPECTNTILPATARANGGQCAPCLQKHAAEERRQFIAANKRVVDPYAGLSEVVDLICAIQTPRERDPLIEFASAPESIETLYAKLTPQDAEKLMDVAAEALKSCNEYFADAVATSLATLTDHNLDRLLRVFIQKNKFWPSIIFRDAGPEIRDLIIEALNSPLAHANHGLAALAWIGDEVVRNQFARWDLEPPPWWEHLYVLPSEYSHAAGWESDSQVRRDLFYKECLEIEASTDQKSRNESVSVADDTHVRCPWCNEKLNLLINLDLSDSRFSFLNVKAKRLPVLTCHICTCYGVVFAEVTSDGGAHWAEGNVRPKYLPVDRSTWPAIPWQGKPIKLRKRRALEAAYWCDSPAASQIGGMPTWIQDDAYPECPCCKRTMMFLAQIDQSAFDGYEGIYYAFLCPQCRITGTMYQQS